MEYGSFEIVWKGAIHALTDDSSVSNKAENQDNDEIAEIEERLSQFLDSLNNSADSLFSQSSTSDFPPTQDESPIKPAPKRKKPAVIDSDSETDDKDERHRDSHDESDSDLEILHEDWRPPRTKSNDIGQLAADHREDWECAAFSDSDVPDSLILSNKYKSNPNEFKKPSLPLKRNPPPQRYGLRLRTMNRQMTSGCNKAPRPHSRKSVTVSIEEELAGEDDFLDSDDEDYSQKIDCGLVENEAQCSDDQSSEESDGDYEKSFINDQTLMSQQLSQESMHAVYLQSIFPD